MTPAEAIELAEDLAVSHGLLDWQIKISYRFRRILGKCIDRRKLIILSGHLIKLDEHRVRQTILHEIAHGIAGCEEGHGPLWIEVARQIGVLNPAPCSSLVGRAEMSRWTATCQFCGLIHYRSRLDRRRIYYCRPCRLFEPLVWKRNS